MMRYGWHHMKLWPGHMGGGLLGLFLFLLFLAVIAALIVWLVRRTRVAHTVAGKVHRDHDVGIGAALHELELRYARGEVSRDEFLRTKDDLTS